MRQKKERQAPVWFKEGAAAQEMSDWFTTPDFGSMLDLLLFHHLLLHNAFHSIAGRLCTNFAVSVVEGVDI